MLCWPYSECFQEHPHGLKSSPTLVKVLQPITPSSAVFNASDDNTPITGWDDTICGQLACELSELCGESQATPVGGGCGERWSIKRRVPVHPRSQPSGRPRQQDNTGESCIIVNNTTITVVVQTIMQYLQQLCFLNILLFLIVEEMLTTWYT